VPALAPLGRAADAPDGPSAGSAARVAVIGAGISGIAAAQALQRRGVEVVVIDRGHRIGGRMAARTLRGTGMAYDGRLVDVGAAYLTASEPGFQAVVDSWVARGLAREWTDTLATADADGRTGVVGGPMRYAAPEGLRSLVEDLAADLPLVVNPQAVEDVVRDGAGVRVDGTAFDAVVLAMPGAQALDLLGDDDALAEVLVRQVYDPTLTLVAAYDERCWEPFEAMFVNDSALLTLVADDGRRRGDDAPVLVAHSAAVLAARHLDDPLGAAPELLAALRRSVGTTADPAWFDVRRWSLARPRRTEGAAFAFDGTVGLCGDAWGATSRIETAWTSGDALGAAVAMHLRARPV
jgi:predicted NAD/FAD-dependent oxidoreductase